MIFNLKYSNDDDDDDDLLDTVVSVDQRLTECEKYHMCHIPVLVCMY